MNPRSGATLHRFAYGLERSGVAARLHDRQRFYLSVYMRSLPVPEERLMDTWSWFRLIEAVASIINPSTGVAETTFDIDGNLMASQFDDTARSTPFAPRFYSRLRLPVLLFETYAIEPTQWGVRDMPDDYRDIKGNATEAFEAVSWQVAGALTGDAAMPLMADLQMIYEKA